MLAVVLAGLFATFAVAPTATPQATPAAAPPAQSRPLREVVYDISYEARSTTSNVEYGGISSGTRATGDHGTVKVDIMAIQNNMLGIEVTETMYKGGGPFSFNGVVAPNGEATFPAQSISAPTRELVQYFATALIPADKTDVGTTWTSNWTAKVSGRDADISNQYTVTKIDGELMTVHAVRTTKVHAFGGNAHTDGTLVLKPALLVPIIGDIRETVDDIGGNAGSKMDITIHFQRLSDTRDAPAK